MATDPTGTLQIWGILLPFVGGLFGAAIGAPGLEWIKDRIGENRRWHIQKAEIVANLRMILGILDAFDQLKNAALGLRVPGFHSEYPASHRELSYSAFAQMQVFDPNVILQTANKLAALHPRDSAKSAAGQRLVQFLYVLTSQINDIKTTTPIPLDKASNSFRIDSDQNKSLCEFDDQVIEFKVFLSGIYASKVGIDSLTIIYDAEIKAAERIVRERRLQASQDQLQAATEKYSATFPQEEPPPTKSPEEPNATDQT